MTTKQDFLTEIVRNPLDDHLRLVFADWCEENGEEAQGQLIRVQMKLEELRLGGDPLPGAERTVLVEALWRTERKLIQRLWSVDKLALIHIFQTTVGPCGSQEVDPTAAFGHPAVTFRYRKGLIDSLTCLRWVDFYVSSGKLFKMYPITGVQVRDRDCRIDTGGLHLHQWQSAGTGSLPVNPDQLPKAIFNRLKCGPLYDTLTYGTDYIFYPNELRAIKDLSRAAVNFGRSCAGLEELDLEL